MQVSDAMSSKFPSDEILADYASGALPPGLYLVRLHAPGFEAVQRLSVVR